MCWFESRTQYLRRKYLRVRRNGNGGSGGKTSKMNGSCRVENGEMGTGSDWKGQDKKRIRERDRENCKAWRQTSECKATMVWTRKKERRRLRGKKDDGDVGAG